MSPETPKFTDPDTKPESNKGRKKKSGKRTVVPLSPLISIGQKTERSKEKNSSSRLDEALANLTLAKRATGEKAGETPKEPKEVKPELDVVASSQPVKPENQTDTHPEIVEASSDKQDLTEPVSEDDEDYESLPSYEPKVSSTERLINGGEFFRLVDGEEQEIPLHGETPAAAIVEEGESASSEVPILTPQLEQQHQARDEQSVPVTTPETVISEQVPEPAVAAGGEAPPPPPPQRPAPLSEQSPEPPRPPVEVLQPRPEDVYNQAGTVPNLAPDNAAEKVATKQEVDNAVYYATKAGQNKGVLSGLLVGGAYEHFKHKRREKKQAKRFEQQAKQLEQSRADNHFFFAEQAKQQAENDRQLHAVEQRFTSAEKRFSAQPTPEKVPTEHIEQLAIPADHRLETSAWHSIEVDAKTGKPVENPAFQYGHEYYHERAQESAPAGQRSVAAGEIALVAAAQSSGASTTTSATSATPPSSPIQIPNATTQGAPTGPTTANEKPTRDVDPNPSVTTGPLWPWLVALFVIIVCLVALLQ